MAKIDSWTSGVGGDTGAQIKTKLLEAQKSVETEGTYIEGDGNVGTPVDLTTAAKTSLGKADSAVQNTGNETIGGVKTFTSSPIIPAPTTDLQAATKKYVDDAITGGGGYTDEQAQDAVGNILTDSSEIDFNYDDATPSITAALKASSIDESKLDASVNASLDKADSALQSSDIGVTVQAYSAVLAATTASFTTADESKLDGIEANADVTDTDNVRSAGALMDDEVTNLADVKAFDPANYATAAQGALADSALQPTDIDTLAELNALLTDATLIDTNDTRLSDARTPLAHTHTHADITDYDTELAGKTNTNAFTPTADYHPATKKYVDDSIVIGGGYTDAQAQDAVGAILTDTAEIDFNYDAILRLITASLKAGSIDETKLDASVNASLDLADSALQPSAIGVSVQAHSAILDATTASFTTADESKLAGIAAGAEVNTIESVTAGEPSGSDVVPNVVKISQANHDAASSAGTLVATTLYIIT